MASLETRGLMQDPHDPTALAWLHERFVAILGSEPYRHKVFVQEILLHPLSREKQRAAVLKLLQKTGRPASLCDDLMQDVMLAIWNSPGTRPPPYEDRGPDS